MPLPGVDTDVGNIGQPIDMGFEIDPDAVWLAFASVIQGDETNDFLVGSDGWDEIHGGGGNDTAFGHGGMDRMFGGAGNDLLFGGDGHDRILGGFGRDHLFGDAGMDEMYGGPGADRMFGGDGDDLLYAENFRPMEIPADWDWSAEFLPKSDWDYLDGGAGNDTMLAGRRGVEMYGRGGDDRLSGSEADDWLFGDHYISDRARDLTDHGDDVIHGYGGRDWLVGGSGDDHLEGGLGSDTVYGEAGHDYLHAGMDDLQGAGAIDDSPDTLSGGAGNDVLIADGGGDVLFGNSHWDHLIGSASTDTLIGGMQGDHIFGGDGNDILIGDDENGFGRSRSYSLDDEIRARERHLDPESDVLNGGDGDDRIFGGLNDDRIYLSNGVDTVWGGLLRDRFYLSTDMTSPDRIMDFESEPVYQGADIILFDDFLGEGESIHSESVIAYRDGADVKLRLDTGELLPVVLVGSDAAFVTYGVGAMEFQAFVLDSDPMA